MPKTLRFNFKHFGKNANAGQVAQVGSLREGAPLFTKDVTLLQDLDNYEDGWYKIALGDNSPAIQDVNAVDYVMSEGIFYIYEMGIPEWQEDTEYQANSFVNDAGILYISLQNENTGHLLSETAWWARWSQPINVVNKGPGVGPYTVAKGDQLIRVNSTGAPGGQAQVILMPTANVPIGHTVKIKNISTSATANTLTVEIVTGNSGTETIDGVLGSVFLDCFPAKEFITLVKTTATNWDIVG